MKLFRPVSFALAQWVLYLAPIIAEAQTYSFVTIAGESSAGSADGPNREARFLHPTGVALDTSGNVFVADMDNHTIRKLTPTGTNWTSITIAGTVGSPGSNDGTNNIARFRYPYALTVDSAGSVFVADTGNNTIRKLTPVESNWVSSTIAGLAGNPGSEDGTNSDARFSSPHGVSVDAIGNVFVADTDNFTIRRLTPRGSDWVSTTIAGLAGHRSPQACTNCDGTNDNVRFGNLSSITLDNAGNVYVGDEVWITDWAAMLIRKVTPMGTDWVTTTIARMDAGPLGVVAGADGNLYASTSWAQAILKLVPIGTNWVSTTIAGEWGTPGRNDGTNGAAQFNRPSAVAIERSGTVYVADTGNNTIRMVRPVGTNWVSGTLAGLPPSSGSVDGTNKAARFLHPQAIAVGPAGEIFVADTDSHIVREIDRAGNNWITRTIAGTPGSPGSADGTNSAAQFNSPRALAVSGSSTLYLADSGNDTIRKLERTGTNWISSTIAGLAGNYFRQDGTNSDARFYRPNAIAVHPSGDLYVAEYDFQSIRRLAPVRTNWVCTTLSNQDSLIITPSPNGLAVGSSGALYIADGTATIDELAPVGPNWIFSIIAGSRGEYASIDGTNAEARFIQPNGIAISQGNLYIADAGIRKLTPIGSDWVATTIDGLGPISGSYWPYGANGEFDGPFSLALDPAGRIYVADTYNNVIRMGVPLPVIISIVQTNGSATFTWTAVTGLSYMPQYNSDLSSTNWTNLGSSIIATNETISVSDALALNQRRFYRVALLP